jgi:hypothetical protein
MLELVPLKSKRVSSSRAAWSTALRASCISTCETTSNVGMPNTLALQILRASPPSRVGARADNGSRL